MWLPHYKWHFLVTSFVSYAAHPISHNFNHPLLRWRLCTRFQTVLLVVSFVLNTVRFTCFHASATLRRQKFKSNMKLLHTCAEESSVHGLAHLVAQNRHWAEKLLWAVILIFSIYFSYGVCLTTWTRYQESPTVLTLETDYRRWMYRRPAATVCPMRVDQTQLHQMIRKYVKSVSALLSQF